MRQKTEKYVLMGADPFVVLFMNHLRDGWYERARSFPYVDGPDLLQLPTAEEG